MNVFFHDLFTFPLPDNHRFPIGKYERLRHTIVKQGIVQEADLHIPRAATDQQLGLAHDMAYIEKVKQGQLNNREVKRLGFPWTAELVERARRSVGSTIEACRSALSEGVAVNLAGGTHHAGRKHGVLAIANPFSNDNG